MQQLQGTVAHSAGIDLRSNPQDSVGHVPQLEGLPLSMPVNVGQQTQINFGADVTESTPRLAKIAQRVYTAPRVLPSRVYATVLQKWEGYVLEVGADTFTARLVSKFGEEVGNEFVAEIYVDEIDAEDQQLLEPGAVFYWSIGYYERPSGRMRFSSIRMRRLPQWSNADLERAGKTAAEFRRLLDGAIDE